jgi:hypothetical protein
MRQELGQPDQEEHVAMIRARRIAEEGGRGIAADCC